MKELATHSEAADIQGEPRRPLQSPLPGEQATFYEKPDKYSVLGTGVNTLYRGETNFEESAKASFELQRTMAQEETHAEDQADYEMLCNNLAELRRISETNRDNYFGDMWFNLATLEPQVEDMLERSRNSGEQEEIKAVLSELKQVETELVQEWELSKTTDTEKYQKTETSMADRSKNWTQYMDIKQRQDILAPLRSEFITARWDYNRLLQMYKTGVDMAELEVQQGELKKIADGYNHEAEMQFAGIDQKFDHDLYLIHLPDFAQTKEALKSPDAFSLAQHQVPDMQRWTDPMGSAAPLAPDIIKVASAREESLERSSYRQRFDAIRQSLEKIKGLSSTRRRFH